MVKYAIRRAILKDDIKQYIIDLKTGLLVGQLSAVCRQRFQTTASGKLYLEDVANALSLQCTT
jgi:hypothetical protein